MDLRSGMETHGAEVGNWCLFSGGIFSAKKWVISMERSVTGLGTELGQFDGVLHPV